MKLTAKRLHLLLLAAIGLAVVVLILGVYVANMLLASQSKRIAKAKLQALVLQEREKQLSKAKADVTKYKDLADIAKTIVPQDKNQAQAVREIVTIANQSGVKLGSVTFPSSTLGGSKPGVKGSNAALSQLKPVANIPGVYVLNITVDSDDASPASYANFLNFLGTLEHNRRTALVTGISLQPNSTNPALTTFSLTLNEYIKP